MTAVLEPPAVEVRPDAADGLIARLTLAAYDVALRQGITGRFTDLQTALWREIGGVIREAGVCRPMALRAVG